VKRLASPTDVRIATRQYQVGPIWVSLAGRFEISAQWSIETLADQGAAGRAVAKDDLSQNIAAEFRCSIDAPPRRAGTSLNRLPILAGTIPAASLAPTARMRRLVIRRFLVEQHQDVLLLLDCGRLMGRVPGTARS
jgi:hypothetical protein